MVGDPSERRLAARVPLRKRFIIAAVIAGILFQLGLFFVIGPAIADLPDLIGDPPPPDKAYAQYLKPYSQEVSTRTVGFGPFTFTKFEFPEEVPQPCLDAEPLLDRVEVPKTDPIKQPIYIRLLSDPGPSYALTTDTFTDPTAEAELSLAPRLLSQLVSDLLLYKRNVRIWTHQTGARLEAVVNMFPDAEDAVLFQEVLTRANCRGAAEVWAVPGVEGSMAMRFQRSPALFTELVSFVRGSRHYQIALTTSSSLRSRAEIERIAVLAEHDATDVSGYDAPAIGPIEECAQHKAYSRVIRSTDVDLRAEDVTRSLMPHLDFAGPVVSEGPLKQPTLSDFGATSGYRRTWDPNPELNVSLYAFPNSAAADRAAIGAIGAACRANARVFLPEVRGAVGFVDSFRTQVFASQGNIVIVAIHGEHGSDAPYAAQLAMDHLRAVGRKTQDS